MDHNEGSDGEEYDDEPLAHVYSEDIERHINKGSLDATCSHDLEGWYEECKHTVQQVMELLDEMQSAAQTVEKTLVPLGKDVSITSMASPIELHQDLDYGVQALVSIVCQGMQWRLGRRGVHHPAELD